MILVAFAAKLHDLGACTLYRRNEAISWSGPSKWYQRSNQCARVGASCADEVLSGKQYTVTKNIGGPMLREADVCWVPHYPRTPEIQDLLV